MPSKIIQEDPTTPTHVKLNSMSDLYTDDAEEEPVSKLDLAGIVSHQRLPGRIELITERGTRTTLVGEEDVLTQADAFLILLGTWADNIICD